MVQSEQILQELKIIRAVLLSELTKNVTQTESIAVLSKAGLAPKEIAEALGTTANTVRVALSTAKTKKSKTIKSTKQTRSK